MPPYLYHPPPELYDLLTLQTPIQTAFRKNIRHYNNLLAFTSVGRDVDERYNNGRGPYSYRLHGELIHRAGSLLPRQDDDPAWSQLYIYDSSMALDCRMRIPLASRLDRSIMQELQDMLHNTHPAVQLYKHAHQISNQIPPEDNCTIVLRFDPNTDRRRYLPPDPRVEEIAVLLPGEGDRPQDCQDIILYRNDGPLHQISDLHPLYPSLRYVLLYPTGQLGWHAHIPYEESEDG